ncbi:hypothetical protein OHS33_38905 (plasmid) [Streptomyces sp. NBC_00536]|uniref:hypothetical protein n=1 Tax=Streptomyces sp. NBC_00536 TaxID=2975769 RepID=UPI002E821840|nr:hypothetical protein [Streptomyces sp. NBC_00536]WUC84328.1 hypothetical protein OHS33_38905 [Streptomyces sp. NBC_00536]
MTHTRGYSPRGERPEPTTAPATPPPVSPPTGPSIDAHAEMIAQLGLWHGFLRARAAETPVVNPLFHESLGYAMGAAEAFLEHADIVGAVRKLEWMRNEADRWERHPDFPGGAPADASDGSH